MEPIEFWKMNGSGNDFILIDNRDGRVAENGMGRLVKKACRRRTSVGADGAIFVVPSKRCDFGWRFFNPDGGEVEMCGNGGRCVARFAHLKGIAGPNMSFETLSGIISAEVKGRTVKVLMPDPSALEMDLDLSHRSGWNTVDSINTGVPHVVIRVEELDSHPVYEQGSALRYHERFSPQGTNVNFFVPTDPHGLEIRTYERGVEGETLACGTGAIAASLVASHRGLVESPVTVKTSGGEELTIYFSMTPHSFEKVWLEGSTSILYQGRLHEEALE